MYKSNRWITIMHI